MFLKANSNGERTNNNDELKQQDKINIYYDNNNNLDYGIVSTTISRYM